MKDIELGKYYMMVDGELTTVHIKKIKEGDVIFYISSTPSTPSDFQFILSRFTLEEMKEEDGKIWYFPIPDDTPIYYCDSLSAYCFFNSEAVIKLFNDVEYFKDLDWYRDSIYYKPWIEEDKIK